MCVRVYVCLRVCVCVPAVLLLRWCRLLLLLLLLACLVGRQQALRQQEQESSSNRWFVRPTWFTTHAPAAAAPLRWSPLLQVTISLLQRAMDDSGKHKFLIDGVPRNEENRASFEAQVRVSVGAVVVRLGWRWGGGG